MHLTVEISLYPNRKDYLVPIKAFIERLNSYADIEVKTFPTSTMIQGDYDTIMDMLKVEMKASREAFGQGIFVTKFIPGYRPHNKAD